MKLRSLTSRPPALLALPSPLGPARGWGGRTVVVGVRDNAAAARELLTWALTMVAATGDRVVALHVVVAGDDDAAAEGTTETEEEEKKTRSAAAAGSLASLLRAYDGFCDLNQIGLELRVLEGSSVKRALVNEASSYGAGHLVVGVTSNSNPFGSSSSAAIAKFCAKRVRQSCSVHAVSNGRVVYRRDAVQQQQLSQCVSPLVETPRRIYRKLIGAASMIGEKPQAHDDSVIGDGWRLHRNVSISMSAPVSPKVALTPIPAKCYRRESPELSPGWPLLKKDLLLPELKSPLPEWPELSVAQWAMQLPSRCPTSSPLNPGKNSDHRDASPGITDSESSSPAIDEPEKKKLPEELVSLREKYSSMYTMFSYTELARITCNFSRDRVVGNGGASQVFKGCTDDGRELAVKVLKCSDTAAAMAEFVSEMEIVSSIHHDNAMPLSGFCLDDGELVLVYDYVARGSLEEILHGVSDGGAGRFGWPERFKVATGVARALAYLHGGERPVIHRDVKSSNILISQDFEPKLCDFGLALWAEDAAAHVAGDDVAGTFGYLAPEYFMHGKVSDKIDVYAMGVVLLELVSGRKPVSAGESLVMWANTVVQGGNKNKLHGLVDPSLATDDVAGEVVVERMALAASLCVRRSPHRRPSIATVLKLLDGDGDAVKWARSQAGLCGGDDDDDGGGEEVGEGEGVLPEKSDIQSYINLALLDVVDDDDDTASVGSADFIAANMSLEEYMKGRWSRSSSFD